jgi:hypothetical protein
MYTIVKDNRKLTAKRIKYLRRLHTLVIHKVSETTKQYYAESRKLEALSDEHLNLICSRCFG